MAEIYYSTFVKQIYLISKTGGNKMEGRGAEVAKRIRESKEWDQDDCRELCNLAGLSQEWEDADGENFEGVVEKAAEILGVEIV